VSADVVVCRSPEVQRCRGAGADELHVCMCACVHVCMCTEVQRRCKGGRGEELQRCRGARLQSRRTRGSDVQRFRGSEDQMCIGA